MKLTARSFKNRAKPLNKWYHITLDFFCISCIIMFVVTLLLVAAYVVMILGQTEAGVYTPALPIPEQHVPGDWNRFSIIHTCRCWHLSAADRRTTGSIHRQEI
jgi:hypothetical protein